MSLSKKRESEGTMELNATDKNLAELSTGEIDSDFGIALPMASNAEQAAGPTDENIEKLKACKVSLRYHQRKHQ